MPAQNVTLRLPTSLYDLFRTRAERTKRPIESELLEVVQTAATSELSLSDDLSQAIADLEVLDDEALWRAARVEQDESGRERLGALTAAQGTAVFGEAESAELEELLHHTDRILLVRAHAAKLLKGRGFDIPLTIEDRSTA